jgi:hypothetical protein
VRVLKIGDLLEEYCAIFPTMEKPEKPTISFLMIGCQRCGTTWTDAALRTHPQIFLPEKKQSYFFDRNYDMGMDWYLDRFQGIDPQQIAVGEIATGYCLLNAIPLLAEHFPNTKLLMVMRNPIDRAYSNYQSRQIEEGWSTFEEALESSADICERGQYIDQIECLLKFYEQDNVLFLLYDDLNADDQAYIKSIYAFIGVDSNVKSEMVGQIKNAAMFLNTRKFLHQVGLKSIVTLISKSWIGDKVRRSRKSKGRAYMPMNLKTKKKLIKHFAPYNKKLATFLGRDLSKWDEI